MPQLRRWMSHKLPAQLSADASGLLQAGALFPRRPQRLPCNSTRGLLASRDLPGQILYLHRRAVILLASCGTKVAMSCWTSGMRCWLPLALQTLLQGTVCAGIAAKFYVPCTPSKHLPAGHSLWLVAASRHLSAGSKTNVSSAIQFASAQAYNSCWQSFSPKKTTVCQHTIA